MANDFTPSEAKRLNSVLKQVDSVTDKVQGLTEEQLAVARAVLGTETEIGKLRIAYLDKFFDTYSAKLDEVAKRQREISEAFLIFEAKLGSTISTELDEKLKEVDSSLEAFAKAYSNNNAPKSGYATFHGKYDNAHFEVVDEQEQAKSNAKTTEAPTNTSESTTEVAATKEPENKNGGGNSGGGGTPPRPPEDDSLPPPEARLAQAARVEIEPTDIDGLHVSDASRERAKTEDVSGSASTIANQLQDIIEYYKQTAQERELQDLGISKNDGTALIDKSADGRSVGGEMHQAQQDIINELNESSKKMTDKHQEAFARLQALGMKVTKDGIAIFEDAAVEEARIAKKRSELYLGAINSELEAAEALADTVATLSIPADELGSIKGRTADAELSTDATKWYNEMLEQQRKQMEYDYRRTHDGKYGEEGAKEVENKLRAEQQEKGLLDENGKLNQKQVLDTYFKEEVRQQKVKENQDKIDNLFTKPTKEDNISKRIKELSAMRDGTLGGDAKILVAALSSLGKQLENTIDKVASYRGPIDTRLQGSKVNEKRAFSYWNDIAQTMTRIGAINPIFKQETFADNIKKAVEQGISFNVTQRAFLETIKDKIATTFNVFDSSLLRLIRIQQADSTAGRLGMEASLNAFLNSMYETTEYLQATAGSVRQSLLEMESLMEGAAAAEVEFQVQKWMGSLYSVGMADNSVTGISTALGQIAAGQIEGITNGGAGNLIIMAANDAGLSIADILTEGIDSKDTNKLLQAAVNYLAELADSAKDNNVVQQQLAGVFGVSASDLRAATNLQQEDSVSEIADTSMTYEKMIQKLYTSALSMSARTSMGEKLSNIWQNGQWSLASGVANDPMLYLLYKSAGLLEMATGGIPIPAIWGMGTGVDLEITIADLMRAGAMAGGILGNIGSMIQGIVSSLNGPLMLRSAGIKLAGSLPLLSRGDSAGISAGDDGGGAQSTSGSGYAGNASGSDIRKSTEQDAEDQKTQLLAEQEEEEDTAKIHFISGYILKIYELLDDVSKGKSSFTVKVEGYGLTKSASNNSALGGAAGVGALGSGTNSLGAGSGAGAFNSGSGNGGSGGGSSGSGAGGGGGSIGGGGGSVGGSAGMNFNGSVSFGDWRTV
jgi:hypothetical protein